jgi:aminoglycoside 6'-N-acetyltransferase I
METMRRAGNCEAPLAPSGWMEQFEADPMRGDSSTENSTVNIELRLSSVVDAHIIQNLWPLYQHDVSQFETSLRPNRHGLFGADDRVTSWVEHADGQGAWWREPESLFPYLILVDGYPAGFNLIAARPRLPEGVDADFMVHEFFVLNAHRGKGVAERAAIEGFERHRGRWEILTWPAHARALAFWRRVLGAAAHEHSEREVDRPWGKRVAFSFDNAAGPSRPLVR